MGIILLLMEQPRYSHFLGVVLSIHNMHDIGPTHVLKCIF